MNETDFLWVEKYRPHTIDDTILPNELKRTFQKFVEDKSIPNLLLTGRAGVGKTTVARAMLEEIGADYTIINGSLNGNIDTLRNDIKNFASAISLTGGRKYVILDEADYLNPNSTQPALRNFMEEYSKNCGFILTCNFKNRIIDPLQSRCSVIDFTITKKQMAQVGFPLVQRLEYILTEEKIPFDRKILVLLVEKFYPDWRRTINELQRYSATGQIDQGILVNFKADQLKLLVEMLKQKQFSEMRKWVAENEIDSATFFRGLYDAAQQHFKPQSIPSLVLIIGKYQYQAAFVADHEINIVACLTEIMVDCEFK